MASDRLPKFKSPPVVETVLGVQFDALPGYQNAHSGAFWQRLGEGWPHVIDAPEIPEQFERFGDSEAWGQVPLKLQVIRAPSSRLQIRNANEDRMVQVQRNRFHFNWLGHSGRDYPTYEQVRPEFDKALGEFRAFLEAESLGEIRPNQWEVTYVNHIPQGALWHTPSDWPKVLTFLSSPDVEAAGILPESLIGQWHYEIAEQRGRLHVELKHARETGGEGRMLLRFTLTARGPVAGENGKGLELGEGLDLGRATIVKTFRALTSSEARDHWEEIQDDTS